MFIQSLDVFFILVRVAYLTLVERHLLGGRQIRTRVSKISFIGFIQPILDGVKLITKGNTYPTTHVFLYNVAPLVCFIIIILEFSALDKIHTWDTLQFGSLFVIIIVGLVSYGILIGGFISMSKYACIGGIRNVIQVISYEIVFTLLFFLICQLSKNLEVPNQLKSILIMWPLLTIWLIVVLVELSRTPFDFSEGERELVRGFNVEYSSYNFVFYFLSEYGSIIFFRLLTSSLFININSLFFILIVYFIIVLRSTLPRFRIDILLYISWMKNLIVILIFYLLFFLFTM